MSTYVTITSATATHPVYHLHGGATGGGERPLLFWTKCGKRISPIWGVNSIQQERAALFARPCKRCFPALHAAVLETAVPSLEGDTP